MTKIFQKILWDFSTMTRLTIHQVAVLPVPRFSHGIGIVWIKRCGKNFAVAGCGFLAGFYHAGTLFWAS